MYLSIFLFIVLAKVLRLPRNLHMTLQKRQAATKPARDLELKGPCESSKSAPDRAKVLRGYARVPILELQLEKCTWVQLSSYLKVAMFELTSRTAVVLQNCESAALATHLV